MKYFAPNWEFYCCTEWVLTLELYFPLLAQPIVLNGIFSAIPYTLMVVVVLAIGPIADYMRRHWFSPTATGKILTTFGMYMYIDQTVNG